jgi:hypothetical protein
MSPPSVIVESFPFLFEKTGARGACAHLRFLVFACGAGPSDARCVTLIG